MIDSFTGEYYFLSNFSPHPVFIYGRGWRTAEHAFQAAKTTDPVERNLIQLQPTPGKAKQVGRKVALIYEWEEVKIDRMTVIVRKKFSQHHDIRERLIATGDEELIEGNTWGDRFWGTVHGVGNNNLGIILMQIRKELTNAE